MYRKEAPSFIWETEHQQIIWNYEIIITTKLSLNHTAPI